MEQDPSRVYFFSINIQNQEFGFGLDFLPDIEGRRFAASPYAWQWIQIASPDLEEDYKWMAGV